MLAAVVQSTPASRGSSCSGQGSFFFQAEDGIRDYKVTGVQTCALPISAEVLDELLHLLHGRRIETSRWLPRVAGLVLGHQSILCRLSIVSSSFKVLKGLTRYSSAPARMPALRSSALPRAVSRMTSVCSSS